MQGLWSRGWEDAVLPVRAGAVVAPRDVGVYSVGDMRAEECDKALKSIKNIVWMPHVGEGYPHAEKRLFVLGLSYWAGGGDEFFERELVKKFVKEWPKRKKWKMFNYSIIDLLLGPNPSAIDVKTAFCRMAKTNLIQSRTQTDVNQDRNKTKQSVQVIDSILQVLQPTHILVCAKTAWDWVGNAEYIKEHKEKVLWIYYPNSQARWRYDKKLSYYRKTIEGWGLGLTNRIDLANSRKH